MTRRTASPVASRSRGYCRLAVGMLALAGATAACATKRDLVDLRDEIRRMDEAQSAAFEDLSLAVQRGNRQALDSVAAASESVLDVRGTLSRDLARIEAAILQFGEIVGQNQYTLTELQRGFGDLRGDFQALSDKVDRLGVDSLGLVVADGPMPATDAASFEAEEFDAAVRLFESESQVARMAFEQFMEFYPNSDNAPRALLYLGQVSIREEEPREAIDTYLSIPERYPESEQVPNALYRAAVVYISLEEFEQARALLLQVIDSFPDHSVAEQARARLDEIP